jgi:hypothetical protein
MSRPRTFVASLSLLGLVAVATGCSDSSTVYYRPGMNEPSAAAPAYPTAAYAEAAPRAMAVAPPSWTTTDWTQTAPEGYVREVVPTPGPCPTPYGACLPVAPPAPVCAPVACAPEPVPCAPPRCACYLPCQNGESDWHARALVGYPFMFGTDSGEGCFYWGVDVGTTRPCCLGFDLFYRGMTCDDGVVSLSPGLSPTAAGPIAARFDRDGYGKDGGTMQWVGLKVTYQKQIRGQLYGWGGVGPEYFWTNDYIDDDSGIGAFGEFGIGWKFASWGSVRLGVDVHADYTSVTRKALANAGKSRLLWTVAPTIGIEIDF